MEILSEEITEIQIVTMRHQSDTKDAGIFSYMSLPNRGYLLKASPGKSKHTDTEDVFLLHGLLQFHFLILLLVGSKRNHGLNWY